MAQTPERKREWGFGYRARPEVKERITKYLKRYKGQYREKLLAKMKERYHGNPAVRERARRSGFRRLYGITLEEYNARLAEQGGVCAICRKPETAMYRGQIKMLAVDHDHESGRKRGLICSACNLILGAAKDSVEILSSAIEYLRHDGGPA